MSSQTTPIVAHTPGPWKTVKPGHGHATAYLCVQIGKDESYTTLELKPEDAHLIAAAPELLSTANDLLMEIDVESIRKAAVQHGVDLYTAAARLLDAIAKAEGRES